MTEKHIEHKAYFVLPGFKTDGFRIAFEICCNLIMCLKTRLLLNATNRGLYTTDVVDVHITIYCQCYRALPDTPHGTNMANKLAFGYI